jgi:hypothetical protein
MPLLLAAALALSGCAKPDWIQQTLVTVDVTGTWQRTEGALMELVLLQEGPKVTGTIRMAGTRGSTPALITGPIEGSVTGDVFRFKLTSAIEASAEVEMLVSGDEMRGDMRGINLSTRAPVQLRRINSSRPASQP